MPQTEGEIQGYGPPTIDLEAFLKNPRIIQLEDLVLAHVMALEAEADPNQNSEPKNPEPKNSKREPREPQTPEALKVLQAWQRLEQLQQQGAPGGKIASQYLELAHFYRDRVKAGQENLMHLVLAIGSYEQTRGYLTNHSCMWAYVLDELGQMYCRLSKITNRHSLACLHRALLVYRQALDHLNPDTQLRTYGAIHNHLGDTFNAIARRHNPVKNLHQAVLAYQSALRVCKPQDLPERYISLQHKLATTYRSLALHQETNYFSHKAAQAYSEAIRYLEADADPEYSGLLHHGLGTIYLNLATLENSQEFLTWALVPIEPL
jgi:tetratricopeptide (TPR) repeat protein